MTKQFAQPTHPTQAELDDIDESLKTALTLIDPSCHKLLLAHPKWCTADHNARDPWGGQPQSFHERPTLKTRDMQVSALIDRLEPEPLVGVWLEVDAISPAQARQLGEAILEAVRLHES